MSTAGCSGTTISCSTAGCEAVTQALLAHGEIDYFYVNYLTAPMAVRDSIMRDEGTGRLPAIDECVVREPESKRLESWEHIFDLPTSNAVEVNTSILSSVFRRRSGSAAPASCG